MKTKKYSQADFKLREILFLTMLFLFFTACKKDNTPEKDKIDATAAFPLGTEWVGTLRPLARQYDKPAYVRFNKDSTLIVYSLLGFIIGNDLVEKDSLSGKVTQIEDSGTGIKIDLKFPAINESQTIIINDKKTLTTIGDVEAAKPNFFTFILEIFPAKTFSLENTTWSGELMHGGAIEGRLAYPDLSSILFSPTGFSKNTTTYFRNGALVQVKVPQTGDFTVVQSVYKQQGCMVWMDGYNESVGIQKLVPYFGVLAPTGDKMWVDSRNVNRRLPNYIDIIDWDGPKGVTPVIYKK